MLDRYKHTRAADDKNVTTEVDDKKKVFLIFIIEFRTR